MPPSARRTSRAQLEQAQQRARALQEIAYALSRSHGEEAVLRLIVDEVVRVLGVDRAVLIVFSEDGRSIEHYVFAGPGADLVLLSAYDDLMRGLTGWVMRERTIAFSPEGAPDPRETPEVQRVRRETHCGSITVLPVQTEATIFATLTVIAVPGAEALRPEDIAWLLTLSHHAAAALEQRRLNDELLWLAQHDALTGLPNRALFDDRVQEAAKRSLRSGRGFAVCVLDLDGFKRINERYGHEVGDEVLKDAAARLSDALRASDTVCRLGGDEFAVLAEGVDDQDACDLVVKKLRGAFERPIERRGIRVDLGLSVGCAVYLRDGGAGRDLLRTADHAMHLDKHARNRARR